MSARTKAWICARLQGSGAPTGDGWAAGGFGIVIPVAFKTSGTHRVLAQLGVGGVIRENLTYAGCLPTWTGGFCDQLARVTCAAYLALQDRTNGTVYYSRNTPDSWYIKSDEVMLANYSSSGWNNFSGNSTVGQAFGPVSLSLNASLNHSHTFILYLQVFAEAEAYVFTSNAILKGTVSASVSMATSGNHVKLQWVTLT
jgi:hypothetical protein